jgi:hypothetical protein
MLRSGMALCFLVLALSSQASAVTLDELKGYSIEINAVRAESFVPDNDRHNRPGNEIAISHRLYIGLNGNIFDYSKTSSGMYAGGGPTVSTLDQAKSVSRGRMKAWTIDGGRLTLLVHVIEGFVIHTITIDPSRSTCAFYETTQADPTTGRVVVQKMNGHVNQVTSFSLVSSECVIKKGNIFAADR